MSEPSYESWGRVRAGAVRAAVSFGGNGFPADRSRGGLLAYGNGRSYGDSCHNNSGLLVDMRGSARILRFDAVTGEIEAEAGILLCEITKAVAASGWFLPVTPGTQFVTLGGAIANDVHGKNHHRRGSFGRWVRRLTLYRSDTDEPILCSPSENADLFRATIGGMGLTGIVGSATLKLIAVPSLTIAETTTRFDRLEDYFEQAEAADERHEYAVAWIDSLSRGSTFGRGHLITGDHAATGSQSGVARPPIARVPLTPPVSPLRGLALRAFNEAYFRKARRGVSQRDVPFDAFFYPLDRIGAWNRLYGPQGLLQHQCVVPFRDAERVVRTMIEQASEAHQGSFLTVLKRFSDMPAAGLLSFARAGYTLTLDFPNRGERTLRLLDELDAVVVSAGGAINPYKDARMAPQTFAASFPRWPELEAMRDPQIVSDFWRRTALALVDRSKHGTRGNGS